MLKRMVVSVGSPVISRGLVPFCLDCGASSGGKRIGGKPGMMSVPNTAEAMAIREI